MFPWPIRTYSPPGQNNLGGDNCSMISQIRHLRLPEALSTPYINYFCTILVKPQAGTSTIRLNNRLTSPGHRINHFSIELHFCMIASLNSAS